jgi:hypothetical protein
VFEIWETRSGNLAGSFETRDEALSVVRAAAEKHGRGYVDTFSLLAFEDGRHRKIAEGADLASLAFAVTQRVSAKGSRERIDATPGRAGGSRFVRRNEQGQFTTFHGTGSSTAAKVSKGETQKDRGDGVSESQPDHPTSKESRAR